MKIKRKNQRVSLDPWIISASLTLIIIGLLMVTSASMVISEQLFNSPFHFLLHQLAYLTLGAALGFLVYRFSLAQWRTWGTYLFIICLFFLIVVLVPGIGHKVNGSTRWIGFGPLTVQVSELAKFSVILYLAGYLVRRDEEIQTSITGFIKPLFLLAIISFSYCLSLTLAQPLSLCLLLWE